MNVIKPTNYYETKRLLIKPTSINDSEFILELMNSPKWLKYIGDRNIHSVNDAKQYIIEKMLPQYKALGYGNFTVYRKTDNCKIGSCGLYDRKGLDGIDLGFAFLPTYEKSGYAFESTNKLISIAFEEYGIKSLKAITTKNNISSQNLLIKLKYVNTGFIKIDNEELLLFTTTNYPTPDRNT